MKHDANATSTELRRSLQAMILWKIPISLLMPRQTISVLPVVTRKDKEESKQTPSEKQPKSIPDVMHRPVPPSLTTTLPKLHTGLETISIDRELDPATVAQRRLPLSQEASFVGSPHALSEAFSGPRVAPERRAPRDDIDVDGTAQIIYGDKLLSSQPDPSYEPMRLGGHPVPAPDVEVGMHVFAPVEGPAAVGAAVHVSGEGEKGEKLKKELSLIGK